MALFMEGGANRLSVLEAQLAASVLGAASGSSRWQMFLPSGGLTLICGPGSAPLMNAGDLAARLREMNVPMVFMKPGTLIFELSDRRRDELRMQVESSCAPVNRDLDPVAFRLASSIWDRWMLIMGILFIFFVLFARGGVWSLLEKGFRMLGRTKSE